MDTPDKIYIADHNANVETGYFSRNKDDVFTQEYIRKDALIEWLEEGYEWVHNPLISVSNLIDKLNLM